MSLKRIGMGKLALLALLVVLQVADVVTTKVALASTGNWEANPAMAWCMANLGAFGWAAPKLALVAFAALAVQRMPRWPLMFGVSIYVAIVANNLFAILHVPGAAI